MKSCPRSSRKSMIAGALATLVLLALAYLPAAAGVPDPTNSECDTCLVISPDGTFLYRLTLKDDANAPVADAVVFLDFNAAPGIVLCSESDPDGDGKVEGMTNSLGVVDFHVRGGGQDLNLVTVTSQLVTFCLTRARTTDLTGNLIVDGADEVAHQGLPLDSPLGDYDCDGDSDADDLAEIQARTGRDCSSVQIAQRSWGRLKAIYH